MMKPPELPALPAPSRSPRSSTSPASCNAAVALAYGNGRAAPQVVAKGRGLVAEAIIEKARTHGVYVHESPELVSLLMQVDLDQAIPPELYRAVAELLAWLYRLDAAAALSPSLSLPAIENKEVKDRDFLNGFLGRPAPGCP
jgi:flagellar biosynthesis protein